MRIEINLPLEEMIDLVMHLGWVGFQMPYLKATQKEIFRKAAKMIWSRMFTQEEQLKSIEDTNSEILKAIYNYKIPDKKNG